MVVVALLYAVHALATLAGEVLWVRQLALVAGLNLPALGIGLAVYVAGMGLGAFAVTAAARRWTMDPLRGFAILQAGLAILALGAPRLLRAFEGALAWLALPPGDPMTWDLRVASALLMLPPAMLAGAVFPVLARLVTRPPWLYAAGTAASAAGALAPLLTVPRLGAFATFVLVALAHALAATAATTVAAKSRRPRERTIPDGLAAHRATAPARTTAHGHVPRSPSNVRAGTSWLLFGLSALTGALVVGAEVIASRFIWLVVEATPHAEGIVVATTLVGLAAGGALAAVMPACRVRPLALPPIALVAMAASLLLLVHGAPEIAAAVDRLVRDGAATNGLAPAAAHALLATISLGVPAVATGLAFAGLLAAVRTTVEGRDALGAAWGWHHAGAALGALGAGLVLVPIAGLTRALVMLAALAVIGAAVTGSAIVRRVPSRIAVAGLASAGLAACAWTAHDGDLTFRDRAAGPERLVFHHEDAAGVVEVVETPARTHRTLFSSRLRQEGASRPDDLVVQRTQGYLPLLLHPRPRTVLAVGLGTGISLGPALRPEVERLTVVEISRGVRLAAPLFAAGQRGILDDPKTTIVQDDGRAFIRLTRDRYDLVVQDLFFPYATGAGALYTVEHYRRAAARLAPGGFLGQWIALNQVTADGLRSILGAFTRALPHATLWLNGGYLLVLGANEPITLALGAFERRAAETDALGGLAAVHSDPSDLLSRFVARAERLAAWIAGAPPNDEDRSFVEHDLARHAGRLNTVALAVDNLRLLRHHLEPLHVLAPDAAPADRERLSRLGEARRLLLDAIIARAGGHPDDALPLYEAALALNPSSHQARSALAADRRARGDAALRAGRLDEAERLLRDALTLGADPWATRFGLALIDARRGRFTDAAGAFRHLRDERPDHAGVHFNLGLSLSALARVEDAAAEFRRVLELDPANEPARRHLTALSPDPSTPPRRMP